LDPEFAGTLMRTYPQLSAAASLYPYGHESIEAAAHERAAREAPRAPVEQPDYILVGLRLIPIPEALRTDFQSQGRVTA
jgi:hypothetical protein